MRQDATRGSGTSSTVRRSLPESKMRAVLVIVADILREKSLQMAFVHCDDVILIEDDEPRGQPKWKRFSQLLNDPQAGRVPCDVDVQDPSTGVVDDEEAVEYAEGDRWNREEVHCGDGFPVVAQKRKPALGWFKISGRTTQPAGNGSLRTSKPSIRSSPWMRGAPQVGFSVTIRKIRSRTSIEILLLPIIRPTLEIARQYKANPALCHRTTVSGFTIMSACFQPDQNPLTRIQKSLSNVTSRGLGCLRFKTVSCCRRTRFSSTRLRRVRNTRRIDAKRTRMRGSMGRWYRESLVQSNSLCC